MNRDEKLFKLREKMKNSGISAVIIPSTDPHSSEYVHSHWKIRGWFSGFYGSAGTLVVTNTKSGLWTDFRYYIEAEESIKGCEIKLYKDGLSETPSISDFLKDNLSSGDILGVDGTLFSTTDYEKYKCDLDKIDVSINTTFDSVQGLWLDRPDKPKSKAYDHLIEYCGEGREDKIARVRGIMAEKSITNYIISSLADIAWLLNIRGDDVTFSPLVLSYLIVTLDDIKLFIDDDKLTTKLKSDLNLSGISIYPYNSVADKIITLKGSTYYMPQSVNCYLSGLIPEKSSVTRGVDITTELKAVKNRVQIENLRKTMELDGAALVKFYFNFLNRLNSETFTEYSLGQLLRESRLSVVGCIDESFAPIVGYCSNGALCHYSAKVDGSKTIKDDGLLLIDSGGQYYGGTTDITRTITLGNATTQEILHYTLVLKGHINLSMAKFPRETTGAQLDILARKPLWDRGLNYGHGTGHGVGYFLGVHEGPQNISPKSYSCGIKEGMITSNEPGIYIEGSYGIRIENLLLTKFSEKGLYQDFLDFETLTLFPYDLNLIDPELLTLDEVEWLNNYHREVKRRLSPYLIADEVKWLEDKTREI